jgi:hypothetical protein
MDMSLTWTCQFKYPVLRGDCRSPMSSRRSGFSPRAFVLCAQCYLSLTTLNSSAASQKLQLHTNMASPRYGRNSTSLCDVTWLCATEWCDNYWTLMCFQFMCILFLYCCWLAFIEAVNIGWWWWWWRRRRQQQQQRIAFALNTLPACLDYPVCQGSGVGAVVFTSLYLV